MNISFLAGPRSAHRLKLGSVAFALVMSAGPSWADPADPTSVNQLLSTIEAQKARLDAQEKLLKDQMQQLDAQEQALRNQQQQIEALRSEVEQAPRAAAAQPALASPPLGTTLLGRLRGAGTGQGQVAQDQPVGQAPAQPERPPEINVLADRGGILTPKGTFVYEPTFEFAHSTDSQAIISGFTVLPILIGTINVTSVNHDTI